MAGPPGDFAKWLNTFAVYIGLHSMQSTEMWNAQSL